MSRFEFNKGWRVIENLPITEYHNSETYSAFISSSQLKNYLISPRYYKYHKDNPEVTSSAALEFGSNFHEAMESVDLGSEDLGLNKWCGKDPFVAPINERTGKPYGPNTRKYIDAVDAYIAEHGYYKPQEQTETITNMVTSLLKDSGTTSTAVREFIQNGESEVSIFGRIDGVFVKVRPDLLTDDAIVDWKSTNSSDLSPKALNSAILRYGYHISAPMYQRALFEATGVWRNFYLVFVSKVAPYDAVIVDMVQYGYRSLPDSPMVIKGYGAEEFERLLSLHRECVETNTWRGAEALYGDNKALEIIPPAYYTTSSEDIIL